MGLRLLVAHDLGPVGDAALAWAANLSRSCDVTLSVVHVAPFAPPFAAREAEGRFAESTDLELLRLRLREVVRRHHVEANVEVLESNDVAAAIVAHARDCQAEMIVLGTHGRTGVRRVLQGSIAESVMRTAECPVTTVRHHGGT